MGRIIGRPAGTGVGASFDRVPLARQASILDGIKLCMSVHLEAYEQHPPKVIT